jgi:dolichyl-phosphate-mannose-protein mannosyltransferase
VSLCLCLCLCHSYCFAAYVFNLLPYLGVSRQAFVYHYMPALYYASILLGLLIDGCVPAHKVPVVVAVLVGLYIAAYVFFSPWVYAFKTTFGEQAAMRWLSSWD